MSAHSKSPGTTVDPNIRRKERIAMAREICLHRGENPNAVDRGGNEGWEKYEPLAGACIREAERLFGLRAGVAQDAPSGWKLVPIEPTDAMVEVGCDNNPTQWNEGTDNGFAVDVANDVYVSMVRSAPAAPQQSPRLEREVVARIIDPDGFSGLETERAWAAQWKKSDDFWLPWQKRCDKALEKSDAILALLSPDTTVVSSTHQGGK